MERSWILAAGLVLPALAGGVACTPGRSSADGGRIVPQVSDPVEEAVVPERPWPEGSEDDSLTVGERQLYTRGNLSDYVDGGAAFFLAYAFQWLAVWDVTAPGLDGRAVVELYRFGEAEDALGIALDRAALGSGLAGFERGVVRKGALRAQSGCYFVRVSTPDRSEKGDELASRLGNLVGAGLPAAKTAVPPVCTALPADAMRDGSLRYFHTRESLDSLYYLAEENLLRLSAETRCGLASYDAGPEGLAPATVVLISYPAADEARAAFAAFSRGYLECEPAAEVARASAELEDGTRAGCAYREDPPMLAIALGAKEQTWATAAVSEALDAYREAQP